MERDREICGFAVTREKLLYSSLLVGGVFFLTVVVMSLMAGHSNPLRPVFYALIGCLLLFSITLIAWKLNLFSLCGSLLKSEAAEDAEVEEKPYSRQYSISMIAYMSGDYVSEDQDVVNPEFLEMRSLPPTDEKSEEVITVDIASTEVL